MPKYNKIKIISETEYQSVTETIINGVSEITPWNIDLSDLDFDLVYTEDDSYVNIENVLRSLSHEERRQILAETVQQLEDIQELSNIEAEVGFIQTPNRDIIYKNLSDKKYYQVMFEEL